VATQHARATPSAETSAQLEQPTAPKLPALNAQACDDAARKPAAATNDKPARSWTKCTTRRANTSYRLTLELSGGVAVRLERDVRHESTYGLPALHACTDWMCMTNAPMSDAVTGPVSSPIATTHWPAKYL